MPNYVTNKLHLSGEQDRIDELLESIKGEETLFDFNKVIPMPEALNIEDGSRTDQGMEAYKNFIAVCKLNGTAERDLLNIPKEKEEAFLRSRANVSPEAWELGKTAFQNEQLYGARSWYRWCIDNWGSKWNAMDTNVIDNVTIIFYTAWSNVYPVIEKLAERFPDIKFDYCWADEDLGSNVGTAGFEKGETVHCSFLEYRSKEAFEFAAEILNYDLGEEGYVFNEKTGTYEWKDES